MISTAARAWQLEGTEVIGTSVAGATAQRLQADASLDRSYSADELNYGIQQGHIRIGPDTVIVFDEAAMADHERIAPLVKLTAERGAKPLLVGDAAQLSSIGPGGLFAALEGRVPTAELRFTAPTTSGSAPRGSKSALANPARRSPNTNPTTACTSTTRAPRQRRRWCRTGTRPATPCPARAR